jgi:Flp pilus assembly protein TadB
MSEERRPRSSLVNALWGAGIQVPETTPERRRGGQRLLATLMALTLGPGVAAGVVVGLLTAAVVPGLVAGVGVYLFTSVVAAIVAIRVDARRGTFTPQRAGRQIRPGD